MAKAEGAAATAPVPNTKVTLALITAKDREVAVPASWAEIEKLEETQATDPRYGISRGRDLARISHDPALQ